MGRGEGLDGEMGGGSAGFGVVVVPQNALLAAICSLSASNHCAQSPC